MYLIYYKLGYAFPVINLVRIYMYNSGKFSVCRICCTKHVVSLKVRAGRKFKRALLLKQVLQVIEFMDGEHSKGVFS